MSTTSNTDANTSRQFAMVPPTFIMSGLSDGAFRLWTYLEFRCGTQGYASFGYAYIAERLGVQRDTVRRWAEELEELKLVHLDRGKGRSKVFIHMLWQPPRLNEPIIPHPVLPPVAERSHNAGKRGKGHNAEILKLKLRSTHLVARSTGVKDTSVAVDTDPFDGSPLSSELAVMDSYDSEEESSSGAHADASNLHREIESLARVITDSSEWPGDGLVTRLRWKASCLGIHEDSFPYNWDELTRESIFQILELPALRQVTEDPPLGGFETEDFSYEWEVAV